MQTYLDLLTDVLNHGVKKQDRTDTGTLSVFGRQIRFNLEEGFPLLTTKRVHWKSVVGELLWFLGASKYGLYAHSLRETYGVTIWDEWDDGTGGLGPIYGSQWRSWGSWDNGEFGLGIDQLAAVINTLKTDPDSRRMIVSAWNVSELGYMALPPCHMMFQFYVVDGKLSCMMTQRSADIFLGLPFNIASYALLTHMVAQVTGLGVGELIISIGDLHLYSNHILKSLEQLEREPMPLPKLFLSPGITDIDDFTPGDIVLVNYQHHPTIKAPVAF